MKPYKKNFLKQNQETAKEEELPSGKPSAEYVINQAIIWIVIVFLAIMIVKKFF